MGTVDETRRKEEKRRLEFRQRGIEWEDIGVADLIKPEDDRENARNFIWGLVQQTKDRNKQNRVTVMTTGVPLFDNQERR